MKNFIFALLLLFVFFGCSNDEIPEFEQTFINNSDYDCLIQFYNSIYEIKAHESKIISKEFHISDDYEAAILLETNYPRVSMKQKLLKMKTYIYTIENASGIVCKIVNTSNYSIRVTHNYLGDAYSEGIYCPAQKTTETRIYKNYDSGFSAIYKNSSTITNTIENDLQDSKCKFLSTSILKDDNKSYLVITVE